MSRTSSFIATSIRSSPFHVRTTFSIPTNENTNLTSRPSSSTREYSPAPSVALPYVLPSSTTVTPASGSPPASVTRPRNVFIFFSSSSSPTAFDGFTTTISPTHSKSYGAPRRIRATASFTVIPSASTDTLHSRDNSSSLYTK